ncbi:hypothetical protein Tco_0928761 [Tanacetum coccineum]
MALVKEVKEMKESFEQMEAEVERNAVDKECADIERKNLLIENENLIADCLSNELLYSVMNNVNTVSRFSELHDAYIVEQARCLELEAEISKLKHEIQKDDHKKVIALQEQNTLFRAENENVKQRYKELYDSIKITRAKILKRQLPLLTPGMYAIDVEPIPPRDRNNREVHLDYLKHLKESVETLCEIVEEAKIEKPLDNAIGNACFYTKQSHEFLEYVIGTCLKEFNKSDKKVATTPLNRKKQVIFKVISSTEASGSNPRSNTKNNRILPAKSDKKKKVKDHPRNSRTDHPLVFGLRLLKTYDGESLSTQEFLHEISSHRDSWILRYDHLWGYFGLWRLVIGARFEVAIQIYIVLC